MEGQNKSAQSAILGLPMLGASNPTSLQKFQASKATLTFGFFIPGSPIADVYPLEGTVRATMELKKLDANRSRCHEYSSKPPIFTFPYSETAHTKILSSVTTHESVVDLAFWGGTRCFEAK